jgi:hypothetical protein
MATGGKGEDGKKERDGERGWDDDEKGLGISLLRGRRDVHKAYDKGVAALIYQDEHVSKLDKLLEL